jgi:light-regulated signal transduction histidine kinase (bacteriophytochrome)
VRRSWASFVASGGEYEPELRFVSPAGTVTWVQTSVVELIDEDGTAAGHLGTVTDLTDRKNAEGELERAYHELIRSNADLAQFAYAASHDLSEPLRVISGFAKLLEQRYSQVLDADGERFVSSILSGAERMQSLIDALLQYSRLGRAEVARIPVDMTELVGEVLDGLSRMVAESDALVDVKPLPSLQAEPTMLAEMLQNLISNAIKFSGETRPWVEISAERETDAWRIDVRDHGIGIQPGMEPRAFEMFQRLHGPEYPGTGIGLAICKRIAERHGGEIWVHPADGGGSVFSFTVSDSARDRQRSDPAVSR